MKTSPLALLALLRCCSPRRSRSPTRATRTTAPSSSRSRPPRPGSTSRSSTSTTACCCTTRAARTSRSSTTRSSRTRRSRRTARSRSTPTRRRTTSTRTASARRRVPQDLPSEPAVEGALQERALRVARPPHALDGQGRPAEPQGQGRRDHDRRLAVPVEVGGTKGDDRRHADVGPARRAAAFRSARSSRFAALIIVLCIAVFIVRRRRGEPCRGRRRSRRGVVRRAVALLLRSRWARAPASAFAHATLQSTIPERGAKLDTPADGGRLHASTSPSRRASARCGSSTPRARRSRPATRSTRAARAQQIAVKLKPGLGDGTYTATYRVVSADGHAVSSGFVFTVGEARRARRSRSTSCSPPAASTGPVTNTALSVARGVQYARDRPRPRRADLLLRLLAPRARRSRAVQRPPGAPPADRRDRRLPLRARRADAAGRRRPGRHVLGRRQARRRSARSSAPASAAPGASPRSPGSSSLAVARHPPAARARGPVRTGPPTPRPRAAAASPPRTFRAGPARTRGALDREDRRARRPALRARAAALARRPHERPVARSRSCCPRTSSTCSR